MPILKSAKKALRQSEKKHQFNLRTKNRVKTAVKEFNKLADELKKSTEKISGDSLKKVQEVLSKAYKAIDKSAKKGIIKKNTAARKKSQLAKKIAGFGRK